MSTLKDFLPNKEKPEVTALIQAHVDESLVKEVRNIMKQYNYTWNEVITACFKQFIEMKKEGNKK